MACEKRSRKIHGLANDLRSQRKGQKKCQKRQRQGNRIENSLRASYPEITFRLLVVDVSDTFSLCRESK